MASYRSSIIITEAGPYPACRHKGKSASIMLGAGYLLLRRGRLLIIKGSSLLKVRGRLLIIKAGLVFLLTQPKAGLGPGTFIDNEVAN